MELQKTKPSIKLTNGIARSIVSLNTRKKNCLGAKRDSLCGRVAIYGPRYSLSFVKQALADTARKRAVFIAVRLFLRSCFGKKRIFVERTESAFFSVHAPAAPHNAERGHHRN